MTTIRVYTTAPVKREVRASAFDPKVGRYVEQKEQVEDTEYFFDSVLDALVFAARFRDLLSRIEINEETEKGVELPLVIMESDALKLIKWSDIVQLISHNRYA